MKNSTVRCIIALGMLLVSCIIMVGCINTKPYIIWHNNIKPEDLGVPANFDIKITGKTIYAYKNEDLPVGEMLKQNVEKNIIKIERFSINKQSKYQYTVGIDIKNIHINDNPLDYPFISCYITVYSETINDKGEKIIEKELFSTSTFSSSSLNYIPSIIENCSKKIVSTLNDIFPKTENGTYTNQSYKYSISKESSIEESEYIEKLIEQSMEIKKSTNHDVLAIIRQFIKQEKSDNRVLRLIKQFIPLSKQHLLSDYKCSSGIRCPFLYSYNYKNDKTVIFRFDYNNILLDISFYKINKKYNFLDMSQKPEININDIGGVHGFLSKITPGMKKGTLFRILGKPDMLSENNDEELWLFLMQPFTFKEDHINNDYRYIYSYNIYYVILRNNTVIDRYVTKCVDLTKEEKSYIVK